MKKLLAALSLLLASIPALAAPINVYQIVGPGGLIDPGLLVQYLAQPITLNTPTISGQILGNDGNATAPTYSFSSLSTLGFYKSGSARIGWTNGGYGGQLTSGGVIIKSTGSLIWGGDDTEAPTLDVFLVRDAADILAQRRTTNPQTFRLYGTFTDASNYQRLRLTQSTLITEAAGTGTLQALTIGPSTQTWAFQNASFNPSTDNAVTIGTAGALRPSNVIVSQHFRSEAATSPAVGGAACGTTPAITGSDHGMTITVGSGGSATTCVFTFGVAFTAAPACVAQNNTDRVSYSIATTTGGATITATAAFTAGSKFYVVCMGS